MSRYIKTSQRERTGIETGRQTGRQREREVVICHPLKKWPLETLSVRLA